MMDEVAAVLRLVVETTEGLEETGVSEVIVGFVSDDAALVKIDKVWVDDNQS